MSIERHFDYVFNVGTIASGASTGPIPLKTQTDGPFVWRSVGAYYILDSGLDTEQALAVPAYLLARWCDADYNWLQTALTPNMLTQPSGERFLPQRRHLTYPAQAVIQFELSNQSGGSLSNVVIIARGVKLFPGDRYTAPVYAPTYPPCYTQSDFQYVANFTLNPGTEQRNIPLYINYDADFAWRSTGIQPNMTVANARTGTLELQFQDMNLKPYASDYIRAEWLCGLQASRPALWYPELYIEKGRQFELNARNPTTGTSVAAVQLALNGSKVFTR